MRRFSGLPPDVLLTLLWRSHQLLPYRPLDGMPSQAFYFDRLGSSEAVVARRAQVWRAGSDAGIQFAFERIEVLPNTAAAHHLIAYAADRGTEAQRAYLIERLFSAYFLEGENIGDAQVLERLGVEGGLEHQGLLNHLAESRSMAVPTCRRGSHSDHNVSGVPTSCLTPCTRLLEPILPVRSSKP